MGRRPVLSVAARRNVSRGGRSASSQSGAGFACYCKGAAYAGGDHAPRRRRRARKAKETTKVAENSQSRRLPLPRFLRRRPRRQGKRSGIPYAIRFKVPRTGATKFDDAVFGPREVQNADIEDFVLLRSNGVPTYQLSVVVDDIDMRITHVIRGADHLSNTPKQVLIYRALGAEPPDFRARSADSRAGPHAPLEAPRRHQRRFLRRRRFSPRSVPQFPRAARLVAPETTTEFLRTPELIERFSLAGVSRTNAIFDRAKLEWFNTQYLQKPPVEELAARTSKAELKRAGLWQDEWGATDKRWFARAVDLIRPRTRLLGDFTSWARAFFTDDFDYDARSARKILEGRKVPALLAKLADCAGRGARLESRCLRRGLARRCCRGRRESRRADQRDPRSDRGPRGSPAALRHYGRDRARRNSPPHAQGG